MFTKLIDLYDYYKIDRNGANGGILTVYERAASKEIKKRIRPAMLIMPGGGYEMISEREAEPIALKYLGEGFSSFVLSYSLKTKYPAPLIEAMLAVAYIRDNAEIFDIDKNKVCAIGFSAGGHLAGLLATLYPKEAEFVKMPYVHVAVNAVILAYSDVSFTEYYHEGTRYGITGGDESLYRYLSVEKRVDENTAPAFIWQTFEDGCVPVENALILANAYKEFKVPFSLHIFEKGGHGLSTADKETCDLRVGQEYVKSVAKWFDLSIDWLKSKGFEAKTSE